MMAQEIARQRELTQLVNKYQPLIKKISFQQWNNMTPSQKEVFGIDEIEGYALEGFALAINNYDPSRSKMNFMQYAAFSMRNNCLTYINEESRTIKVSFYNQQKMKESGEAQVFTTSIDRFLPNDDDDAAQDHYAFLGFSESFEDGNPIEELVRAVKDEFDKETADIFFSFYGLDGHKDLKGIELAEKYHISNASITVRVKKVIKFIQQNDDLMDILRNLL